MSSSRSSAASDPAGKSARIGLPIGLAMMALLWMLGMSPAAWPQPVILDDPQQQALYDRLIRELRCLVCQNQNLADSNAGLADDLKTKTRDMVAAGKNYDEVIAYMTERYGDFVLYRPPLKASTWLLWVGPFLLLAGALVLVLRRVHRPAAAQPAAVDEQDAARARDLLQKANRESGE